MDEVKITIKTATGAVLHNLEELKEYMKTRSTGCAQEVMAVVHKTMRRRAQHYKGGIYEQNREDE